MPLAQADAACQLLVSCLCRLWLAGGAQAVVFDVAGQV